jgi:hypothetical protein
MIGSVPMPSGVIQGRLPGWNTAGSPFQQRVLWMQRSGCQTTVTSPLV